MKRLTCSLSLLLIPGLLACSGGKEYLNQVSKEKPAYSIATRQLPPDPAFSMTKWVRPPLMKPSREMPEQISSKRISPVVHYKVQDVTLKEAALVLASTTRYRSYCSSLIADQRLTLDGLGTLDELADEIETLAGIQVIVDHEHKEVRFLARGSEAA